VYGRLGIMRDQSFRGSDGAWRLSPIAGAGPPSGEKDRRVGFPGGGGGGGGKKTPKSRVHEPRMTYLLKLVEATTHSPTAKRKVAPGGGSERKLIPQQEGQRPAAIRTKKFPIRKSATK